MLLGEAAGRSRGHGEPSPVRTGQPQARTPQGRAPELHPQAAPHPPVQPAQRSGAPGRATPGEPAQEPLPCAAGTGGSMGGSMLQGRGLGPGPCGRKGGRQGQGTRDSPAGGWMSVAASLKTSPPGGAPDGDLPEGACSENEVRVPPPGPGSAPRSVAGPPTRHPHVSSAPRRTPAQGTNAHRVTRLSCSSSSSGSAGTRTTRGWTGLTFALQQPQSPLPRTVRRPGPRSPGRPPATRARVPGGSPPTCRGPLTRQCPGGRVAEAAFRGPHGHVREELGGTGGRTRQPRPRPRPRRCVPTARTTPPPALLTRPFNLPTERPRVQPLTGDAATASSKRGELGGPAEPATGTGQLAGGPPALSAARHSPGRSPSAQGLSP